jgi:phosphoribosylglycinamide formyltransferase-1
VRLGVLVSGKGSNLRNLVERGFEVVAVATNRASCGGAAFARERGLRVAAFAQRDYESLEARDADMARWLLEHGVELLACAGYDRVLSAPLLDAFPGRILNIHPSLLPAFAGGMDAVARALAARVPETGCTVHLVTPEVDGGPILVQAAVPVLPGDDEASLRARIQVEEHRIYPEAIRLLEESFATAGAAQR